MLSALALAAPNVVLSPHVKTGKVRKAGRQHHVNGSKTYAPNGGTKAAERRMRQMAKAAE
jgi:hypothetical protein